MSLSYDSTKFFEPHGFGVAGNGLENFLFLDTCSGMYVDVFGSSLLDTVGCAGFVCLFLFCVGGLVGDCGVYVVVDVRNKWEYFSSVR